MRWLLLLGCLAPACGQYGEEDSDEEECGLPDEVIDADDDKLGITPSDAATRYGGERTAELTWWDGSDPTTVFVTLTLDPDDAEAKTLDCSPQQYLFVAATLTLRTGDAQIDETWATRALVDGTLLARVELEPNTGLGDLATSEQFVQLRIDVTETGTTGELKVDGDPVATW